MTARRIVVLLGLASFTAATIAACTLNPQPLPPSDFGAAEGSDASADGGRGQEPAPTASDAATNNDGDGSPEGGADGGDAGDASADAPDGD